MIFRYAADRLPVSIILTLSCIDFCIYLWVDITWFLVVYWLLMIIPKGYICAWNHHHQHKLTFKKSYLNRILEFFYALHTGATTNVWVLHHVLGHHCNYMDQDKDESRWRKKTGETMNVIEYIASVALTSYWRAFKVSKKFPAIGKTFVIYGVLTFGIVTLLTWFKPMSALFLFILPMMISLLLTAWGTAIHHRGLDSDNHFFASRNELDRFYNIVSGNLGYHTAHHYRLGVHWSKLPALHKKIEHKIPSHLIKNNNFWSKLLSSK